MFLEFTFGHANGPVIKCPCWKCGFKKWQTRDIVHEHLTITHLPQNYIIWYLHGEGPSLSESMNGTSAHVVEDLIEPENEMEDKLNDAFGFTGHNVNDFDQDDGLQNNMGRDEATMNFDMLFKDNNEPLYEGCRKYSNYRIKWRQQDRVNIYVVVFLVFHKGTGFE